jgi:hypothetical protein
MCCLYVLIIISALTKPEIANLLDLYVSIFSLVALYGFCYNKKILFKDFWKISFFMCVITEGINGYIQMSKNFKFVTLIMVLIFGSIFVLPIYYAFYQYAFKKNDIWKLNSKS